MTHHNLPPALVKTLDNIPAHDISDYLSERIRKEHNHHTWVDNYNDRLIRSLYNCLDTDTRMLCFAELEGLEVTP